MEKYNIIILLKNKNLVKIRVGGKAVAKNTQKQIKVEQNTQPQQVGLTAEEQIKLDKHYALRAANYKLIKRAKKPFRYERIVYRLKSRLPINATRILYPYKKKELEDLKSRAPKKRARAKRASNRKKNMIIALLLLIFIVGAVGVGTYFIYQSITNKETNRVITGEVVFVNSTEISIPVENARLNKDIEKPVIIKNETNAAMYVRFKIEITDEEGNPAEGDLEQLDIRYTYDMGKWYLDSSQNYLYYKGMVLRGQQIQPITHFQIYSVNANENYWAGRTIGIKFTAEVEQTRESGEDRPPHWSKGWHNIMERH